VPVRSRGAMKVSSPRSARSAGPEAPGAASMGKVMASAESWATMRKAPLSMEASRWRGCSGWIAPSPTASGAGLKMPWTREWVRGVVAWAVQRPAARAAPRRMRCMEVLLYG